MIVKNADLVVGFGGFAAFPVLAAAVLCRVPIFIHEQNTTVGLVNRIFSRYAATFFTSFETKYMPQNAIFVGNPIRECVFEVVRRRNKITSELQIFVTGGSQGASFFDREIAKNIVALPENIKNHLRIVQQVRAENIAEVSAIYAADLNIKIPVIEPFFDNTPQIIADSDLVISRAGATIIAELQHIKTPSILIPLPNSAGNHQYINAENFTTMGGATMVEQYEISKLKDTIYNLLNDDRKALLDMKNGLKHLQANTAAQKLAIKINQFLFNRKDR